ncbi:hypothetical protein OCS_06586 [Ophiocordyceps sinensis CO18]|uniref:Uncharacterized protein n=1 Tax=Ophiocordyceps sinensis (strain Co18 / CGMCC 3.14243) TaxID=911162 RepID=T5A7J9_OPHSC|nr:hypothetical protein OCS_06586 [Ophiocordyceps sinensis CO18]
MPPTTPTTIMPPTTPTTIMPPTTPTPPVADDDTNFASYVANALGGNFGDIELSPMPGAAPVTPSPPVVTPGPRGTAPPRRAVVTPGAVTSAAVTSESPTSTPRRRRRDGLVPYRFRRQQPRVVSLETQVPRGSEDENPLFRAALEMVPVALAAVGVNMCALVFQPTSEHREVLGRPSQR